MQTIAVRNQNPGNLKDPSTGGFQSFSDPLDGKAALYNDLTAKMTGTSKTGLNGSSSLLDFANTYAPEGDGNDPVQYAANLANKLGVSPDTQIGTLMPRIDDFASAVSSNEDPSASYQTHQPINMGGVQPASMQKPVEFKPQYQSNAQTTQDGNDTSNEGLGAQISGRVKDLSQAISDTSSGKQGYFSGLLQSAGAVAGGVGDVTNAALRLIPGVGAVEDAIGNKVGDFFKTDTGRQVAQSMQQFSQDHPELSKDIGAGINIVSAIPILKGLGVAKDVAMDAASIALKKSAEKAAIEDLSATVSRTIGGRNALQANPDAVATLIKTRAIPDIVDGRYNTEEAFKRIEDSVTSLDDNLDRVLQSSSGGAKPVIDLNKVRNDALTSAKKSLEGQAGYKPTINKINEIFDAANESDRAIPIEGNKYMSLSDSNFFKRQARKGLTWDDTVGQDAGYHVGQAYMKEIERIASQEGLGDVHAINQQMGSLLKAQKMLDYIRGKKVDTGFIGTALRTAGTAGGEMIGKASGIPFAGAYAGYKGGSFLSQLAPESIRQGILERTTQGAFKGSLGSKIKNVANGVVKGLLPQATVKKSGEVSK